jgi:hypothetical protein
MTGLTVGLTDGLTDELNDGLTDGLTDELNDGLTDGLNSVLTDRPVNARFFIKFSIQGLRIIVRQVARRLRNEFGFAQCS